MSPVSRSNKARQIASVIAAILLPGALTACTNEPRDAIVGEPIQANIPAGAFDTDGISRFATFRADVLILASRRYDFFLKDDMSTWAPVDWAVAWGPSARADVHSEVSVHQRARNFFWSASGPQLDDPRVASFGRHSANWHMVPETDAVARVMRRVSSGDVVSLEGYLVDLRSPDGLEFRSSRTREDTGSGACEIFLVSRARIIEG